MQTTPPQLIMQQGPAINQVFDLVNERLHIGRSADNEIPINDAEVSRRHARLIRQRDGSYAIEDLGSTNGTFVNNERCQTVTPLHDGDVVGLGDSVTLRYQAAVEIPDEEIAVADDDTADLEPLPVVTPPMATFEPEEMADDEEPLVPQPASPGGEPLWAQRRVLIGCGCFLLLTVCLCSSSLLFLDWYRQGELLYCGGLRPFFEVILSLGPQDFSPVACP